MAGRQYYIALDGTNGQMGDLSLSLLADPINDNFTNRTILSGYTVHAVGSTYGATTEPGEVQNIFSPEGAGTGASVWFTWTAPATGLVTVAYSGDGFNAGVGIYTGDSITNLTLVDSGDDYPFSFNAVSNATYQISLAGWWGWNGDYAMDLILNLGAQNNSFGKRITVSGTNLTIFADTSGAAKQTLWWEYIAPANGSMRIDYSAITAFAPVFNVYSGKTQGSLKLAPVETTSNPSQFFFNTTAGGIYQISLAGYKGSNGPIDLQLEFEQTPANDDFENSALLTGDSLTVFTDNRGATEQAGEPKHDGLVGAHSLWWTWVSDTNETIALSATGDIFSPRLAVYRGGSLRSLVSVASNIIDAHVLTGLAFHADAGVAYQIAVDSPYGQFGNVALSLTAMAPPANDNFSNSAVLSGTSASVAAANVAATSELGEPAHAGSPASHSLWWTWTPAASASVTIDTEGSTFDTVLAVYTGGALTDLTVIAANDDVPDGGSTSSVTFAASAGVTYHIAVDGFDSAVGSIWLNLNEIVQPGSAMVTGQKQNSGYVAIPGKGIAGGRHVIQTSTNLVDWTPISTNQTKGAELNFRQPVDAASPARFYRAIPLR